MLDKIQHLFLKRTKAESEEGRKLLHPNWALIEEHFQQEIPPILKAHYMNPRRLLLRDYQIKIPFPLYYINRLDIEEFLPINEERIEGKDSPTANYFFFASSGSTSYGLDMEDQPCVEDIVMYDYVSWDLQYLDLSLQDFLESPALIPVYE